MNIHEIPPSIILEQTQKYTPRQMRYLYEKVDANHGSTRKAIKDLFDKAEKLQDELVLTILTEKYDMLSIFERDLSGLPQVTKESTDKNFKDIYKLIKTINPYDDQVIINQRSHFIEKCNKKPRKRRYGSNKFCCCFKETKDGIVFSIKSYLYRTTSDVIKILAESLICEKSLLSKTFPEIVDWILHQKRLEKELLCLLRRYPDNFPIPLVDIVDMEKGVIKMSRLSINEIN